MPATTFFGRDTERAALVDLVSSAPLVTVTGPGGVGKTRLVHEVIPALRMLTDDLVVAELAELPVDADVGAIVGQLGFASADAAAAALAARSAVVVLDNGEHVRRALAELVHQALSTDADLRFVVTSRETLGVPGERVLVLDPLPVPTGAVVDEEASPSVQLFLDRSTSAGARWPRSPELLAQVAELCRRLDGLPLAIELAAARSRALSPSDLLELVDGSFEMLSRRDNSLDKRHQSVSRSIEASVRLLDEDERAVFARLGTFVGPFDAALAFAAAAGDHIDRLHLLDVLSRLVDRSLVVTEHAEGLTRYRLLGLLREYANDMLEASGELEAAQDRFVDAMAACADSIVASSIDGWSPALLETVSSVARNLQAAIEWTLQHDDRPDRAFRLYLPLFTVVHQSRSHEVFDLGVRIFDRWPDMGAPWRAEALAVVATAAAIGERRDATDTGLAADRFGRAALDDSRTTPIAAMVAHRALGLSARTRHDFEAARAHFAAGRAAAAGLDAGSFERELAGFEAGALDLLGRSDEALALAESVIADGTEAQDWFTVTWVRLVASTALMRLGRWLEAEEQVDRARAVVEEVHGAWWRGAVLRQFAVLAASKASAVGINRGWVSSVPYWLEAIEQAGERGSAGEVAMTLRTAAAVASKLGERDIARALLEAAPAQTELTVLPELFPDESAQLHVSHDLTAPRPSLPEALRRARALLVVGAGETSATAGSPASDASAVLQRDGDGWRIEYGGRSVRVRHLKGMVDLTVLVSRPDEDVHCLELMGAADVGGSAGDVLDDRARREYQKRIAELQREIDDATAANDPARAERAELELDALVQQLSDAFGLGGRSRPQGAAAERARTAVAYRLRAARKRIAESHPELGRHLDNAIRTGTWCSYRPESPITWDVSL